MASHEECNVEIHLSKKDEKFQFHATTLTLHSRWFKDALSEKWTSGSETTLFNGKNHWVFELKFKKNDGDGTLWRKCAVNDSKTADMEIISGVKDKLPRGSSAAAIDLHKRRTKCVKAHQSMFNIFHIIGPTFSHSSFDSAVSSITELAKVADYYSCQPKVKLPIDHHLLLYRVEVEDRCARTPLEMLELATIVKSERIFMDAAAHLLGSCSENFDHALPNLDELGVADLMKSKRADLPEARTVRGGNVEVSTNQHAEPSNGRAKLELFPTLAIHSTQLRTGLRARCRLRRSVSLYLVSSHRHAAPLPLSGNIEFPRNSVCRRRRGDGSPSRE
jgi:hypothetical protein